MAERTVGKVQVEVVLDIETYRDLPEHLLAVMESRLKARGNLRDPRKIAEDLDEKRARLRAEAALSPLTGRVVAWGIAWRATSGDALGSWQPRSLAAWDEDSLLGTLAEKLRVHRPDRIVTWNGRLFDVPFLVARCALHDGAATYAWPTGYDRRLVDLRDVFREGSLEEWSVRLLGERKALEGGGAAVAELVEGGRWEELARYAEDDARKTALLWDRVRPLLADRGR